MKMKKLIAAALAMSMTLALAACGGGGTASSNPSSGSQPAGSTPAASSQPAASNPAPSGASEITLWTYPIGNWKDENEVKKRPGRDQRRQRGRHEGLHPHQRRCV